MNNEKQKILLLVEDDDQIFRVLMKNFEQEGLQVLSAKNGEDGLAICLEKHPNLIVLDIVMPRMDGITMLEKLRQDEWGKNARVLILTNLVDLEKEAAAAKQKVAGFLIKTEWPIDKLMERIKKELELS